MARCAQCTIMRPRRQFSLGTPFSSVNNTDIHDITGILLKVALNTILIKISFQANNNPSRIILHFLYYNSTCTCFCFFIYTNGIIKTLITSLEHFICYFRSQYTQGTMRNVHKSRLYHQKDSCLFSQSLFYLSTFTYILRS